MGRPGTGAPAFSVGPWEPGALDKESLLPGLPPLWGGVHWGSHKPLNISLGTPSWARGRAQSPSLSTSPSQTLCLSLSLSPLFLSCLPNPSLAYLGSGSLSVRLSPSLSVPFPIFHISLSRILNSPGDLLLLGLEHLGLWVNVLVPWALSLCTCPTQASPPVCPFHILTPSAALPPSSSPPHLGGPLPLFSPSPLLPQEESP